MATVDLTTEQLIDLVRRLPSQSKREALFALASDGHARRDQRLQLAEERLQRLCAGRGLDWNAMTEEQREAFIDDLVHEDRPCLR